jgi:hypothetical protein
VRVARWATILALVFGAVATAMFAVREPVLKAAGWALVVDEPVGKVDIIVVAANADGPGVLEAADLFHSGIAARVAVFADPPDVVDREFARRGIAYEDRASVSSRQLRALGVTAVEQIPRASAGTQAEADVLPPWCDQHRFGAIVVVSTRDHSRRLRRLLDRAMRGHQTRATVRPARYSQFDPDHWWKTRAGIRTGLIELQKLLLDVIRHPAP